MIKVITDNKIKDCSQCPLKPGYTRDCGKVISKSIEHGKRYDKTPDKRCKVKSR